VSAGEEPPAGGEPGSPPRQIVIVRHADTEWSRAGRHTGRTDVPLTDEGRARAAELAERLRARRFALVLVSPLRRARETCELAGLAASAEQRADLLEWDYGDYEGLTTPQIRARRPGWNLWRDGCPGGEDAAQVGIRADRVIAETAAADGDVALFSHGHVLRVLGARWVDLQPRQGARLGLSTGAACVLGHERETAVLVRWNDTGHPDAV
jgi:broad specificity phosphatase PhoE